MAVRPEDVPGPAWYAHPVYARYWSHYRYTQAWVRSHHRARRRALMEAAQGLSWSYRVGLPFPCDPSLADPVSRRDARSHAAVPRYNHCPAAQAAGHRERRRQPQPHQHQQQQHGRQHRQQHYHHQQRLHEEAPDLKSDEGDEDSDAESEEGSDAEITDELRAYFAETERHREERRLEQEREDERAEGMVWADEPPGAKQASGRAPVERPGERRRVEMARLYGEAASARILALEAAVQLEFDRQCDRAQPKYWPVIPLKL